MTAMTTVKVSKELRDRLRDAARAAHVSQSELIDQLLTEHEEAEFWQALEQAPGYTDEEWVEFRQSEAAALSDAERFLAREDPQ